AVAKRMEDVELAAYGNDKELAIACGPRTEPDTVYLTWRRADAAQRAAGLLGTAVAVEFVPRDYLP
ncbi:MAG: hypothetical protein DMG01_16800, partial [Acidobacteria bacterium]